MTIYFINPLGSSTNPYDTRAKGATTLKILLDNIIQADDDIFEFCDGGIIDDSGATIPLITKRIWFRSHSENIDKPIIKAAGNVHIIRLDGGASVTGFKIHDLIFQNEGDFLTGQPTVDIAAFTYTHACEILRCDFQAIGGVTDNAKQGIGIISPSIFNLSLIIDDNTFVNYDYPIVLDAEPS
jgi:hypothetical protein